MSCLAGNIYNSEVDEIPSSDATQCSSDKSTNLKQPVGVLMKEEEFFQERKQKQMNTSKLVT